MPTLLRLLVAAGLLLGVVLLLAWLGQRRLLYFPTTGDLAASLPRARSAGLEPWLDPAGRFLGWRAPAAGAPRARVVALHGNAGSALDRTYLADVLQGPGAPPVEVHLLEYPGYGPRAGSPGEEALVGAAVEALDLLGGEAPVFLVGESLGSAVAARAAALRPGVAGVVLITPLSSVTAVARRHYPFLPAFLVRDALRADLALPGYGGPVAFLVAGRDEVVFADLGLALFAAYPGPKRLWVEAQASHNTLRYQPGDPQWAELWGFLLAPRPR
ncbi:MAG: alpha/beta hydrolase [Anaeromyxobacter sp.]|nr:alpha/beta hydrolase [Anaeromyxobacter sp.]MBL0275023.1 alpha/beta hydrolase [Anaeromyxobacter sp.]